MALSIRMFENTDRMHDPKKFTRGFHRIGKPTEEDHLHYAEALYYTQQFSECSRFLNQIINTIDDEFAILYLKNILARSESVQSNTPTAKIIFEDIIAKITKIFEINSSVESDQGLNYRRLIARTYLDYVDAGSFDLSLNNKNKESIKESIKHLSFLKEDDTFKRIISLGLCQHDASLLQSAEDSKKSESTQGINMLGFSEQIVAEIGKKHLFNYAEVLRLLYVINSQWVTFENHETIGRYVDFALKSYQHLFQKNGDNNENVMHLDVAQLYYKKQDVVAWHLDRSSGKVEFEEYAKQSLELAQKSANIYIAILGMNSLATSISYNNLGSALDKMLKFEEALEFFLTAISIKRNILHNMYSLALSRQYLNIGRCYFFLKQYKEALRYIDLVISIYQLNNAKESEEKGEDDVQDAYFYKSLIYIKLNNKDAEAFLVKGFEACKENQGQSMYHFVRGNLQRAEGDYQDADNSYGLAMGYAKNNPAEILMILIAQARLAVLKARKSWQNRQMADAIAEASKQYNEAEKIYEQILQEYYLPAHAGEYRIGKTYLEHAKLFLDPEKVKEKEKRLNKAKEHLLKAKGYSNAEMHLVEVSARINAEKNRALLEAHDWNLTSHYDYAQLSDLVYQDTPSLTDLPAGKWRLMSNAAEKKLNRKSFWAQAFINVERREIVIAYRGTEFHLGDIKTDFRLFQAELSSQFSYAILFFSAIVKDYLDKEKDDENFYNFRLTGHSLGGALALYVLYIALYRPDINKLAIPSDLRENLYAIVFDAAGIYDLLEQIEQSQLPSERKLEMNKRVINYVANPHVVNAAMGQVGQLIRIHFPDNDAAIQIGYKVFSVGWMASINPQIRSLYRFATQHRMISITSAFDSKTGRLSQKYPITLIQNWPHGLHELHQYLILAQRIIDENFKLNSSAEVLSSLEHLAQNKTHYMGSTFSVEGIQFIAKDQMDLSIWQKLVAILNEHAKNNTEILESTDDVEKMEEIFFALTSYIQKNDTLCSIVLPASSLVIVANRVARNRMQKESESHRRNSTALTMVATTRDLNLYQQVSVQKTGSLLSSRSQSKRQNKITPIWTTQSSMLTSSQNVLQLPAGLIVGTSVSDGDCLFDAVAQLINDHRDARAMRKLAVTYMKSNPDKFVDFFTEESKESRLNALNARIMYIDGTKNHGDDYEVAALAWALNRQIIVFSNDNPIVLGDDDDGHPILFLHHHFNTIGRNQYGHYQPITVAQHVDVKKVRNDLRETIDRQTKIRQQK